MTATYVDYVMQHATDKPSDDTPFELLGGYVSAQTWVRAKTLGLDELQKEHRVGIARAYAKDIVRALRRSPALKECAGVLRERAEQLAGLAVHGNQDPTLRTLHHISGLSATGTRSELGRLTGLSYDRVRDLLTRRRPYALGWALTAERARKGPGAPGRPRKPAPPPELKAKAPEPEFFAESGANLF